MKCQSMFPFRRNGPKKRGKGGGGGGGRRHHDNGGGGGGRRVPGSAAELLPMMQPTTKALAQMLAGNTKMSGQLVHARNVLAQANRMVEDRLPDRLSPSAREQFFEQLAVLKLTIADAEEGGLAPKRQSRPRGRRYPWMRTVCARWRFALPPPSRHRRCRSPPCAARATTSGPNPADVPQRLYAVAFATERRGCRGSDRGQWHGAAPRASAAEAGAAASFRLGRLIGAPVFDRFTAPPCH